MSAENPQTSIPTLGCATGMGAVMTGGITSSILLLQDQLSWSGIGVALLNCLLLGYVFGIIFGVIYKASPLNILIASKRRGNRLNPFAVTLTIVLLGLIFVGGIWAAISTAQHNNTFIWRWF